jgi:hypothetical protein
MTTTPETTRRPNTYDTPTPGLIVHDYGPDGEQWRLTHEASGQALGEFDEYDDAQNAAAALSDTADWTVGRDTLQDEGVIWKAIDAIEANEGRFICRKGGLGEQVANRRAVQTLLMDLGEFHTRTCVSPLPKHPAAMGWQASSGNMAAGFARALHALNEVAPEKAAEIAAWFDGPLEDGPDPEEHTDWLERHVAGGPEALERWADDGRQMAVEAKAFTEKWEKEHRTV